MLFTPDKEEVVEELDEPVFSPLEFDEEEEEEEDEEEEEEEEEEDGPRFV